MTEMGIDGDLLRSPAAAVVSMTGGATTLKGGTVTISGTNSLVAAHSYSELSNVYGGSGGGDDTGIWENPDDLAPLLIPLKFLRMRRLSPIQERTARLPLR